MGQANSRQEEFWEACGFGRPHIVRQMIKDGIDVNWKSFTHDCCPIHVASQGKPEIVKLLLEAKCDVHVKDIRDNTALHHAAMKGHAAIMETLIKAGIDTDAQDKNGWTALHNACYWCYPEAVAVLIKNGCNVHLTNKDNRTALHETARSKEPDDRKLGDITRQLLQAGSNVNAKGNDLGEVDFTSLMFSSYHGHPEVANRLIEAGCDVNACGESNWWTSLHWAVDRQQEELVYILLDAGADPTKKGTRGELPADRAKSDDMKEILMNAMNMFRELQALEKDKSPGSPSRLSRISYSSLSSLNHSPTKTGPHGLVEEGQFSPPRSPMKHSDLSSLIDKINQKSGKLQLVARHDKGDKQARGDNSAITPPSLQKGDETALEPKTDVPVEKDAKDVDVSKESDCEEEVEKRLTEEMNAAVIDEPGDTAATSCVEDTSDAPNASQPSEDMTSASNSDSQMSANTTSASPDTASASDVSPPDMSGTASAPTSTAEVSSHSQKPEKAETTI